MTIIMISACSENNEHPPEEVLKQQPEDMLAWVNTRLNGEVSVAQDFNWHGLAQIAAMKAHGPSASPVWAEIAVRVYAWLAIRSDAETARSFTVSEMYVRAQQIVLSGACPGHAVRDSAVLVTWFHGARRFSLSEARAKSVNWRCLPITEIRYLRAIKNYLGVFERIVSSLSPNAQVEIQGWLELRSRLP